MTGIIVLVGGGLLAFHVLKSSARSIVTAGVIGAIGLAAWSAWPRYNAVAMARKPPPAAATAETRKVAKKKPPRKVHRGSNLAGSRGRPRAALLASGNPSAPATNPKASGHQTPPAQPGRRAHNTASDPRGIAEGERQETERQKQEATNPQSEPQLYGNRAARRRAAQQQQANARESNQQGGKQAGKPGSQKPPPKMRSAEDIINDFKRVQAKHAQRMKAMGVNPPAPVGRLSTGAVGGRFFPRMQIPGWGGGMPHMGGHDGDNR
jgi:hypothetical protein